MTQMVIFVTAFIGHFYQKAQDKTKEAKKIICVCNKLILRQKSDANSLTGASQNKILYWCTLSTLVWVAEKIYLQLIFKYDAV
jgi:hypothetical protein